MTISSLLKSTYRLGVLNSPLQFGLIELANSGSEFKKLRKNKSFADEGSLMSSLTVTIDTAYSLPSIAIYNSFGETYVQMFGTIQTYYYQIWTLPALISVVDVEFNSGIPFTIWNAFPYNNPVNNIIVSGSPGTAIDFDNTYVFDPVEFRATTVILTDSAPFSGITYYEFGFTYEKSFLTFIFQASSKIAEVLPEMPIQEEWEWKTDILTSKENTVEQRISVRSFPRISMSYKMLVLKEIDRLVNYNRLFDEFGGAKVVPFFQYSARTTTDAMASQTRVYFDPQTCDARVGEPLYVYPASQRQFSSYTVTALHADGASITPGLDKNYSRGSYIVAGQICLLTDGSGFVMKNTNGELQINAKRLNPRTEFTRPGATPTIRRHNGRPVFHQRYLANKAIDEKFAMGDTIIDSETGIFDVVRNRSYPYFTSSGQFKIKRIAEPESMDYWRAIFDEIRGMQGSFYIPSWHRDFTLREDIGTNTNIMLMTSNRWAKLFEGKPEFSSIQLQAQDGDTLFRTITSVTTGGAGPNFVLNENIPDDDKWKTKNIVISFLYLARLTSDTVVLEHNSLESYLDVSFRTVIE